MITQRGFSAWIVSEGNPLREYLVAVDRNANKISCWIPSETGKSFSVHWRDEGSQVHSCSFISLDGFVVPGRFLNGYGEAWREGVRTGPETERPFVFAEQTNTSSGTQVDRDVGTIMLKIKLISMDGEKLANSLQQLPEPFGSQSNMLSHYISYGKERNTYQQYPFTWNVKPHDGSGNRSYVTFVFRYRSREFLLSQGIMSTEDALQIPPAVRKSCAMSRRVVSAPLPLRSSTLMTPSPTPSPQMTDNSEGMGSAMQNAINPGSVPIRPVTNVRTVSMKAPSRHVRYPGEGILDLGPAMGLNMMGMWPECGEGSRKTDGGPEFKNV